MVVARIAPSLVALGISLFHAGCATDENRPAPALAVMDLEGRDCVRAPDLANPPIATLKADSAMTLKLDAATPCLQSGGAKSTYIVIQLPDAATPYLVGVTSQLRGQNLLAPRLMVLDAQGAVLRERGRDDFMFQGLNLYAGVRAYPGDRYLVIASDPKYVGGQDTQLQSNMRTVVVTTGIASSFPINTGAEANKAFTYAHSGIVTVSARTLSTVNEPPVRTAPPNPR